MDKRGGERVMMIEGRREGDDKKVRREGDDDKRGGERVMIRGAERG